MEMEGMERAAKKVRQRRDFKAGSALNTSEHFWVPWEEFEDCLDILVNQKKWLLISGPFQSGKSSLAFALADEAAKDWISLVTTLTTDMVDVANDSTLSEMEASDRFFALLAEAIVIDSGGVLKKAPPSSETPRAGMMQVLRLLQKGFSGEPDVIWFIDEAALLNEITRPNIIRSFLSGLRTCKERSRRDRGVYRLRSFALVGTAKTRMLLANAREERILVAGEAYMTSSPSNRHDSYNPFPPGVPISSLSMERNRELDLLRQEDIFSMLRRYGLEHGITFVIGEDGGNDQNTQALEKIAADIYERTNGYKGMVGSCCEYLQIHGIRSWTRWKREVRDGYVTKYVLNFKVYSKILSNVPKYSERLRNLILECVNSGCGVPFQDRDMNWVLPAVNDGVLAVGPSGDSINVTSALLLGAILEDCRLACSEPAERVDTFEAAVRSSFRYMKPRCLVLNRNGQPSEYIWQSEFLLALKFVLDSGYNGCRYVVLVECKKRNKRGHRVDFHLRNAGSPNKAAFEVQGKGDAQSIKAHIARSERYRRLYAGCEMNYVYFTVGEDEAKATIESESVRFDNIKCWFVQYLPEDNEWNIEQLHVGSGWHSVRLAPPSHYPRFMFGTRQF